MQKEKVLGKHLGADGRVFCKVKWCTCHEADRTQINPTGLIQMCNTLVRHQSVLCFGKG